MEEVKKTPHLSKEEQLWEASTVGDLVTIKELASDPTVDVTWGDLVLQRTPFYRACGHGRTEVAKYLLHHPRVELNQVSGEGGTPFNVACAFGQTEIVRMLMLDERIDVQKPMNTGGSPFLIASEKGHAEVVSMLWADSRIDINFANYNLSTPLWFASQNVHLSVVQLILACGKDVDVEKKAIAGPSAWNNTTAFEIAMLMAGRGRWGNETLVQHARITRDAGLIAQLITDFKADPQSTRRRLWNVAGIREPLIAEIFALVVFLSDGFVILKDDHLTDGHNATTQVRRFFKVAEVLPLDLQMVLCNRLFSSPKDIVLTKYSETAFKKLAKTSTWTV
jgi:hypothetical protein